MDRHHDATDIGDTHTSSDPPSEISVPHDFFISNFSPELRTWLAHVLDGDDNDDFHEILNLFDSIYELCKKACELNEILRVRIHNDQWLRNEITWKTPKDLSSSESRDIITQSNFLPRQASWTKLRTSVPQRILDNIAGRVQRTLGFDAIEDGDPRGTCTLPEGLKTDVQKIWKADIKLPVFQSEQRIDSGVAGVVWKVIISQSVFAMKKFRIRELLRAEADIVEVLSHPHIVHTFGYTGLQDPNAGTDQLSLVMECMEDDLRGWILSKPPLEPLESLDVLLQVAQAMEYLHGERVVHGDLKSKNILISQFDISRDARQFIVVKVADFGSAQKANSDPINCKPGTTKWSPPEVLRCIKSGDYNLKHPFKADVYSFGLIAYEVLTGLLIFNNAPPGVEKLKEQIMANDFSQYLTSFDGEKDKYPESFISFMKRCWAFEPTERPNFHEIIEKIKDARSPLITRSSETPVSKATSKTRCFTRTVKKVTHRKTSKTTKTSKICGQPRTTQPVSSFVESRVSEDKTKIIEKNKEVKKGSKSKLGVAGRNLITKGKKAEREVKKLFDKGFNKGIKLLKASCTREVANYPKSTAKQVSPPPTQPNLQSGAPIETRAQEDKGEKRKFEDDACKDGSEQVIKSNKKSRL